MHEVDRPAITSAVRSEPVESIAVEGC
jgi:hypothetical protein